jgi:general secretion pathway protein M
MNDWWRGLNTRERWAVGGGAVALSAVLIYVLLWQPLQQRLRGLRQTVAAQQAEVAWMRQAAAEVQRLSRVPVPAQTLLPERRSLLVLVDGSAGGAGLGGAVKRVEPQGDDRLQVQLEQVGFDALIRWLADLQRRHGIVIDNAALEGQTEGGRVNARLILLRNPP